MTYEESIELLKRAVKESHLPGQKHVDLSVCTAEERPKYEKALMIVRQSVIKEERTHDQTLIDLGIN